MFRRLAREAVIFMLVGMVLLGVSGAVWSYKDRPDNPYLWLVVVWGAAIGFIGGFGVWGFYRLVRFAVKG